LTLTAGAMLEVETTSLPADAVEVGRIVGAWGIKGWVRVQPFSGDPQALFSTRQWLLCAATPIARAAAAPRPQGAARLVKVAQAKEHGDGIVAQLHDVPDRSAAEALKGQSIWVSRQSFPTPDADEYYWVDLIGLDVINREGDRLGTVAELFSTGPQSVMRVLSGAADDPSTVETLIPFVAAYVDEVRLAERLIRVDWGRDF
jgi:16S rRNA processing protein RimM